jgi:hypothetical protein
MSIAKVETLLLSKTDFLSFSFGSYNSGYAGITVSSFAKLTPVFLADIYSKLSRSSTVKP